ncbi:MAG: thiamine phosphate synthase [Dehalococcoidia bacterium]|nr:MAG: thiamine phosphate synthase [Dehalococcoidia bacterium]
MSGAASTFPRLIVVADRDYVADDERWLALIAEIAMHTASRPVAIQVRMKGASRAKAGVLAAHVRQVIPRGVPLLLNGEAALAARLGYSGVHWPEEDIPAARPSYPLAFRSAAVHSVEAARRAECAGADLAVFGAVYAPGSKPGTGAGAEALSAVARATALPVFAIGGIHPQHVAECLRAGAYGVAVVSGILGAPDVRAAVDLYQEILAIHAVPAAYPVREGGFR